MGAPAKRIEMSDEERATLRLWSSAGTTQQHLAVRARVVLAAEEGLPLVEISRRTGLSVNNCLKWRKRFVVERIEGRYVDSTNHHNFLNFLKHLYRTNPGKELHIIADNLSAHKHKEILACVNSRRRLHLHFTPAYASWLNQIEIWFNIFARAVLKGGVWQSKQQLISKIMKYIRCYNEEQAHPFRWTYEGKPLSHN